VASITIRNFDDELKQLLRVRAAKHGNSMGQEARDILRTALEKPPTLPKNLETATHKRFNKHGEVELELQPSKGLGTEIHELFKPLGGVDLELLPREPMPEPPRFD
jgi:plasmid stability protein